LSTIKENKEKIILRIISGCFALILSYWLIDKIIFLNKIYF